VLLPVHHSDNCERPVRNAPSNEDEVQRMGRYDAKTFGLDLPDGWDDKSVVAFAAPHKPGARATSTFVITRKAPEPGETLKTFAGRHLAALAQTLRKFALRENREFSTKSGSFPQYEFT
jgi:hypothetical protein